MCKNEDVEKSHLSENIMYFYGLQELNAMDGYRTTLVEDDSEYDIEEICASYQAPIKEWLSAKINLSGLI